ncbi:hypothetical protein GN316_18120 [Xylophilus sp. Kf1]|nr:hypothetical protein [Xylophilus sp. Kf1]
MIFSFLGLRALGGKTSGTDLLLRAGFDVVSVESKVDDWHQGLPVAEVRRLAGFLAAHYRTVHGYGSSMGAYAALAFADIFRFSRVLAISPQFRIDLPFDRRWETYAERIAWQYRLETVASQADIFLVFDPANDDGLHIPMIVAKFPSARISRLPIRYSGHPSTFWLQRAGLLKRLVLETMADGMPSLNLRAARRDNSVHFRELGMALFHRRRYAWSADCLQKAVEKGETGAQMHKFLSGAQGRAGRMVAAIENARIAVDLAAPGKEKAGCLAHLGHLLHHAGRRDDAIRRFDEAIALMPSNDGYRAARESLKKAAGHSTV